MKRVETLINKLQEQLTAGTAPQELLNTVRMMEVELSSLATSAEKDRTIHIPPVFFNEPAAPLHETEVTTHAETVEEEPVAAVPENSEAATPETSENGLSVEVKKFDFRIKEKQEDMTAAADAPSAEEQEPATEPETEEKTPEPAEAIVVQAEVPVEDTVEAAEAGPVAAPETPEPVAAEAAETATPVAKEAPAEEEVAEEEKVFQVLQVDEAELEAELEEIKKNAETLNYMGARTKPHLLTEEDEEFPTLVRRDERDYEQEDGKKPFQQEINFSEHATARSGASLNETLRNSGHELSEKLTHTPIKDLRKAISINEKFVFVRELFRNDDAMYERSLKTINNFSIYPEAEYWIRRELKLKLGWDEKDENVQRFDHFVRRRFSAT